MTLWFVLSVNIHRGFDRKRAYIPIAKARGFTPVLIKATTVNIRGGYLPQVSRVFDLTYQGHQFLDEIRSDNVWNKTKETAKSIGSFSVNTLSTIATGVITSLAQKSLGLQ